MTTTRQINDAIKSIEFHHFRGTNQVACCCVLQNGYSVVGLSPCLPDEMFDIQFGQGMAKDDAEAKIGALLEFIDRELKGEMTAH